MNQFVDYVDDAMEDFGEIVIDTGRMELSLLTGIIHLAENLPVKTEEIYYVFFTKEGCHALHPVFTRYAPLRGYMNLHQYQNMLNVWGWNYPRYHSVRGLFSDSRDDQIINLYEIDPDEHNPVLKLRRKERAPFLDHKERRTT